MIGIGSVATAWAVFETAIQMALCELVQSPSPLGQALTDGLGPDNRAAALKRLCATWKASLRDDRDAERETISKVAACGTWFDKRKAKRNQVVHLCWFRKSDDEIIGWKHNTRPYSTETPPHRERAITLRTTELVEFAAEITAKANELLGLVSELETLPTWPRKYPEQPPHETET